MRSGFSDTATFDLSSAYMHQSVKESTIGKYNSFGVDSCSIFGDHTANRLVIRPFRLVINNKRNYLILPHIEIGGILKRFTPCGAKLHAIALSTRTPHSRSLGTVEHSELDSCKVSDTAHLTAKCIYLSDYLAFSYTTHSRVTAHLRNFVHVHSYQQRTRTDTGSRMGRLAPGMAGADNYNIII